MGISGVGTTVIMETVVGIQIHISTHSITIQATRPIKRTHIRLRTLRITRTHQVITPIAILTPTQVTTR